MSKNLFLEIKRLKKSHSLRTQVHAAYTGTSLHTQQRFQRHKKGKFSTLKTKVWNEYESHIVWEPFQTHIFKLYKASHGTFSKHIEIPQEKPKIHQKRVNQKGVFHKTPSSQFYLIETFSSPNPFCLMLLITFLLFCEQT